MYIQNLRQLSPQDIPLIKSVIESQSARTGIDDYLVKNIRVSNTEIQLDIFVLGNDPRGVQEEVAAKIASCLERDIGPLNGKINLSAGLTIGLSEHAIIERVIQSFNDERYWEAQETAEAIWIKTTNPDEKNVVQGLILVGAALVHHQRNEDQVCLSILKRALTKLQALDRIPADRRMFLSINIRSLKAEVLAIVSEGRVSDIKLSRDVSQSAQP